jgi:hypothetical protein
MLPWHQNCNWEVAIDLDWLQLSFARSAKRSVTRRPRVYTWDSCCNEYKSFCFQGWEAVWSAKCTPIFRSQTLHPSFWTWRQYFSPKCYGLPVITFKTRAIFIYNYIWNTLWFNLTSLKPYRCKYFFCGALVSWILWRWHKNNDFLHIHDKGIFIIRVQYWTFSIVC